MKDSSPEAFEELRRYVQKKLLKSDVIPEHQANPVNPHSIAARIVANAWRQYDRKKYADFGIEQAIKFPPSPIDTQHFSLRAFISMKKST